MGRQAGATFAQAPSGTPKKPPRPRQQCCRGARPSAQSTRVTSPAREQGRRSLATQDPGPRAPPVLDSCLRGAELSQVSMLLAHARQVLQKDFHPKHSTSQVFLTSFRIRSLLLPAWALGLRAHPLPDGHPQWLHEDPSHRASTETALRPVAMGKCGAASTQAEALPTADLTQPPPCQPWWVKELDQEKIQTHREGGQRLEPAHGSSPG